MFAYISDADVEEWQSSIDIVLRRFTEYHDLEGAFGRRAFTERAKGILMERHAVDETSAYKMLREESRTNNLKLLDVAAAVVDGHRLLPEAATVSFVEAAAPRPVSAHGRGSATLSRILRGGRTDQTETHAPTSGMLRGPSRTHHQPPSHPRRR